LLLSDIGAAHPLRASAKGVPARLRTPGTE